MAFDLGGFFDDLVTKAEEVTEDVGDFLDFGFGNGPDGPTTTANFEGDQPGRNTRDTRRTTSRDIDLTDLDRANPTNVHFPNPLGMSTPLLVVGGLVATLITLKALKVI